ncbi:MAG: N-acyl homoserine lactonase family protein [Actinomycetota bacterium]
MRITPLQVGKIEAKLKIVTGEEGSRTLPILSWLIEHPKGLALFDVGMHAGLQDDISRLGRTAESFMPDYHAGDEVSARLAAVDVAPTDIDLIIYSHLHFDHSGGTVEIPDARLVVQRPEWEAGHSQRLIEAGVYDPVDYDHGHDVEQVDGHHDVFGDGRVVCVPTPGHTAGHQALRVELDSGPVVLTGDCIYFEEMLTEMTVPRFGFDTDQQRQSMLELKRLRDEEGCRLLYGHDEAQVAGFGDGPMV